MNLIFLKIQLGDKKGSGLIWVYLISLVLSLVSAGFYGISTWHSRYITIDAERERAFYFAEAGVDQKLAELRAGNVSNINSTIIDSGSYSVVYDAATKMITSTGTADGMSRTVSARVAKAIPPGVRAAMTGNGNMSTNGSIVIDGRDHDLNGNVVGPGTYGVSTTGTYSQGGSSSVGGNGTAPADPAPANTTETGAPAMASTPEELLGLPVGSLDQYKTTTLPTLPMQNQIVYLTANGTSSTWNAPDFGDEDYPSSGILIFHNSTSTAELKNLHGHFNGIIIVDQLTHINGDATINGAVIAMQVNSNVGNGDANVNYSTIAIDNTPLGQFGVVSWEDKLNSAITYT